MRIAGQITLLRDDAEVRRTMTIDGLAQMSVAYFVVFAIQMAMHRFGMTLQAAAGLITLQGALYVAALFSGGMLVTRWRDDLRYLIAFVMLLAQSLLYGLGGGPWALWLGAALMGVGVGLQGVTSTTRFGELMRRLGRGRIGGLTSLARPPAASSVRSRAVWSASAWAPRRASCCWAWRMPRCASYTCSGCVRRAPGEHRRGDGLSSPSLADWSMQTIGILAGADGMTRPFLRWSRPATA